MFDIKTKIKKYHFKNTIKKYLKKSLMKTFENVCKEVCYTVDNFWMLSKLLEKILNFSRKNTSIICLMR